MKEKIFVDTNVLIYLFSNSENEKKEIAKEYFLDKQKSIHISTQVLGEFANILYKKYKYPINIIRKTIREFKDYYYIQIINIDTIELALEIIDLYKYSYWDSLIIASSLQLNCNVLLTEDLHNNHLIKDSLQTINPFKF